MGVLVDTSVLVAAERGLVDFAALRRRAMDAPAGVAAITMSEFLHGASRANDLTVRTRRFAVAESLLRDLAVFAFGLREAQRHAELWAHLQREGTPIGAHDMLIAATALARGLDVVTLNRREFSRVPGLRLLDLDG